jgi:hypothetical protein
MRAHIAVVGVLFLAAGASSLSASPVTISGSGIVTSLGDPEDVCVPCAMEVLGFSFDVGDTLTFSLSFETPSADQAPGDPTFGSYDLGSGMFTLDGGKFTTPALTGAQILNTPGPAGPFEIADELSIAANSPGQPQLRRIGLGLSGSDTVGNWLTTDQWPADVAATLNAAPVNTVWLFDNIAEHGTFARLGDVHFTQTTSVPEPLTIVLVGTGLAGIGARRRVLSRSR